MTERGELAELRALIRSLEERVQKLETRMMARFDRLEDSVETMQKHVERLKTGRVG